MNNDNRLQTYNHTGGANHQDPRVKQLAVDVLRWLPYDPNDDQMLVIVALAHFLLYAAERSVFILGGYAGTGKTSLTGAIVKALHQQGVKSVLMAPTGRAAHIFSDYSGHPAYTIHRKIYRQQGYGIDAFGLAENKHTSTVFIVDEASMISNASDGSIFGSGRLLEDLIGYVYNGLGCKLVLMGDNAQLPPVGQLVSPALDDEILRSMGLTTYGVFLRQIARQAEESGILHNATLLRQAMEEGVHRSAPDAKVIVWDWGWRGHGMATDIIERLPKSVWLQSVSEWALPLNRGGVPVQVGEYSISAVGPGPRAKAHWAAAKKAGLKAVAKCQFNTTWEIASIPSIPALDLVARHAANLSRSGVDGVMAGWSLGGFPSVNLEIVHAFAVDPAATEEGVLNAMAARYFGEDGAALARRGWRGSSASRTN